MRGAARGLVCWACPLMLLAGCVGSPQPGLPSGPSVEQTTATAAEPQAKLPLARFPEEPWRFFNDPGVIITSSYYRVYTTAIDSPTASSLPGDLDRAMNAYLALAPGLRPPARPLEVYMLASPRQYAAATRAFLEEQADAYVRLGEGGYTSRGRAVYRDLGRERTATLAAHEGWHQLTQATFQEQLPVWLEEGIAALMEPAREIDIGGGAVRTPSPWARPPRLERLIRLHDEQRLLPISAFSRIRPTDLLDREESALDYYAQAWGIAMFLFYGPDEQYSRGVQQAVLDAQAGELRRRVIARLGAGTGREITHRTGTSVLEAYTNLRPGSFDAEFTSWVLLLKREVERARD